MSGQGIATFNVIESREITLNISNKTELNLQKKQIGIHMGTGISIICQNCGYAKDFMLGIGMMYSSLEKVIDLVPHRKKILDILQNHKVIKDEFRWDNPYYEHKLYRCSSCNQLHERFYVKIEYDDKKVYETKFKCKKCKNELKAVEDEKDVKKYPCPECNKKEFSIQEVVLWD